MQSVVSSRYGTETEIGIESEIKTGNQSENIVSVGSETGSETGSGDKILTENEIHNAIMKEFPPPPKITTQPVKAKPETKPEMTKPKIRIKSGSNSIAQSQNRDSYIGLMEKNEENKNENIFQKKSRNSFKALLQQFENGNHPNTVCNMILGYDSCVIWHL